MQTHTEQAYMQMDSYLGTQQNTSNSAMTHQKEKAI